MSDYPRALRDATESDLDALCAIEQACSPSPWAREALLADIQRSWSRVLLAESAHPSDEAGAHDPAARWPVAFVSSWLVADELQVLNVATLPTHRRRGHARALLERLIADAVAKGASTALLEVRASNEGALALYRALGFDAVGLRPRYYEDGEDAVLMTAKLTRASSPGGRAEP